MAGFLFALIAVFLAGIGARDQIVVAGLSARQGARPGLLLTGMAASLASAALATETLGWTLPELVAEPRLRVVRRIVGGLLLVLAAWLALRALG